MTRTAQFSTRASLSDWCRFFVKIRIGGQDGVCWIWTGAYRDSKYGTFWFDGRNVRAHRFSYIGYYGPIAKGRVILHSCDDPRCVNPAHLSAGPQIDNVKDMIRKGRGWWQNV